MREARCVDCNACVVDGRDIRAELTQHARRALDVGTGEQTGELARAPRQRREHQDAVGDALVAGWLDDPARPHGPTPRRHSAARVSHAVRPRASPGTISRAAVSPCRHGVTYTTARRNRSGRDASNPWRWVPASG